MGSREKGAKIFGCCMGTVTSFHSSSLAMGEKRSHLGICANSCDLRAVSDAA